MAATRRRIAAPQQIKDLDDANKALSQIAEYQIRLESIDGNAAQEIGKLKERAAKEGEPFRQKIADLENALALYAEYNKQELFADKKTISLSWGDMGFRESTKVSVKKTTLELLKKLFAGRAVRVQEAVDKNELAKFQDEELAQVDAAKVTQDAFWYEVNRDEVNKSLMGA